jgi:ABC-type glycerol-3-phosphate transport system permease component
MASLATPPVVDSLQSKRSQSQYSRSVDRLRVRRWLTHIILFVCGVFWMYPFLWALGSSFKSVDGFFNEGLSIIPKEFEWSNYVNAWNEASFSLYFFNTVFVTVFTVICTVIISSMAGYVLAKMSFPGKKIFIGIIAVTLFLPHGYTIIPVYDIVQRLGLLDSLWSVIIVEAAGGLVFSTFLFVGYFSSIDRELEDAARVDGANFHQLFWFIMFPLAGPMIATVSLFTFIGSWNNFFIPLVFTLGQQEMQTLPVGMFAFIGQNSTEWTYLCAASVITLVPIILLFVVLQRYFINGIAGAIKA